MSYERGSVRRPPTHPGYVVRMELEALGMTVKEAARRLGVARPSLSAVTNERRSVSPEMALRLGRFFGNGTEVWMRMQTAYDRWTVENDPDALRAAEKVEPIGA